MMHSLVILASTAVALLPLESGQRGARVCFALHAAKNGFGGAAVSTKNKKSSMPAVPERFADLSPSAIQRVLDPRLFDDPKTLADVGSQLRSGQVVVLRDAFVPEFAEAAHRELLESNAWANNEKYFADGYGYKHHNMYDQGSWSKELRSTLDVFTSAETQRFMSDLTGRDCGGETVGSPSWYKPGDHSLPHTDHVGQRTVAYIWHLSRDWRPEWGGALYWAQNPLGNAYHAASFNTLILFSVTTKSAHFVTSVSPAATQRRLAFNGWWQSDWVPSADDPLEEILSTAEKRRDITHLQIKAVQDILDDGWIQIDPKRRHIIESLTQDLIKESYPTQA